jgi:hypothetical protein
MNSTCHLNPILKIRSSLWGVGDERPNFTFIKIFIVKLLVYKIHIENYNEGKMTIFLSETVFSRLLPEYNQLLLF